MVDNSSTNPCNAIFSKMVKSFEKERLALIPLVESYGRHKSFVNYVMTT